MKFRYLLTIIFLLQAALLIVCCIALFDMVNILHQTAADRQQTEMLIEAWDEQMKESAKFREQLKAFMDKLQAETFETTAYSPHDDRNGLNSWRPKLASRSYQVRTFTGTIPGPGTVAVDPTVIPLGTKLWIEGYGFARAEDTGSAVKGRHIDLYVPDFKQAMEYGRQKKKVIRVKEAQ